MKKKDNQYTQLKIGDKVVSAKVHKLAGKDLTNFTSRLPPEYRVKDLAWDTDFIAEMAKKGIKMQVALSEEQQKVIDESNKKMNEIISEINDAINKKLESIPRECRFVQINLTYDGEVVQTLKYDIDHDVKGK